MTRYIIRLIEVVGFTLCLSFLTPTPQALGGVIRHDVDPAAYGGLLAGLPAVGSVWSGDDPTRAGSFGSGVLIGDRHVLTAAHVVTGNQTTFTLDGQTYRAGRVSIHPNWNGNVFHGADLAIIKLDAGVPAPPSPMLAEQDPLGQIATFAGYGMQGLGADGATLPLGTLNTGQNRLDKVGKSFWPLLSDDLWMADFDAGTGIPYSYNGTSALGGTDIPIAGGGSTINRMGDAAPLPLEYLPAAGDSGGGVFVEVDGAWRLVGITSFNMAWDGTNNAGYTDMVGVVALREHADWIGAATASDTPAPALPEPGVAVLLAGGLSVVAPRTRR